MEFINNIIYQAIVYLSPVLLATLGGIFAYKANVLNISLDIPTVEEGPGYGGAMLAMVGCGLFGSVEEAADALVRIAHTVEPDPVIAARYEERYRKFRQIYPAVKNLFPLIR